QEHARYTRTGRGEGQEFGDGVAVRRREIADVQLEREEMRQRENVLERRRVDGARGIAIHLIVDGDGDLVPFGEGDQPFRHGHRERRTYAPDAEGFDLAEGRVDLLIGERIVICERARVQRQAGGGQFAARLVEHA